MSFIQIKNVPEDLHVAVRRRAADESMTISEYVLELLRRDLALPSRREWLAQLATRDPVDVDPSSLLDAVRSERHDELTGT